MNLSFPKWNVSILSILFTFNSSKTSKFFTIQDVASSLLLNIFALSTTLPIVEFSSAGVNVSKMPFIFFNITSFAFSLLQ